MSNDQAVEYTGDCANGQGTCTLANGDKYEGAWANKLYHGHGTYSWARGDTYEGEWRGGVIQGQGRMRFSSSAQYEGRWANSEPHGPGTWSWSCGGSWRGHFAKGKPVRSARRAPAASGGDAGEEQGVWALGERRNLPCVRAPGPSKNERHARTIPPRILQAAELAQMQAEDAVLTEVNVRWRREAVPKDRLKRACKKVWEGGQAGRAQERGSCICGALLMGVPCICEGMVGRRSTRRGRSRHSATVVQRTGKRLAPLSPGLRRGNVLGKAPTRAAPASSSPALKKALSRSTPSSTRRLKPSLLPALGEDLSRSAPSLTRRLNCAAAAAALPALRKASCRAVPSSPVSVCLLNFSALVTGIPKQLTKRSLPGTPYSTPTGPLAHSRNASANSSRAQSRRPSQSGGRLTPSFPNEVVERLETLPAVHHLATLPEGDG